MYYQSNTLPLKVTMAENCRSRRLAHLLQRDWGRWGRLLVWNTHKLEGVWDMNTASIRNVTTAAAAIILAGLSVPAAAQTHTNVTGASGQGTAAVTAPRQSAEQDQRVCVRVELTGTRVARNVCRTRAEWAREGGIPRD